MLDDIKVENAHVEFSDPKSDWKETVCFTDIINTILDFIKKLLSFEFELD